MKDVTSIGCGCNFLVLRDVTFNSGDVTFNSGNVTLVLRDVTSIECNFCFRGYNY